MRRVLRTVVVLLAWPFVYVADRVRGYHGTSTYFRRGLEWARGDYGPTIPTATEPARVNRRNVDREFGDEMQTVVGAHTSAYHPGRRCREDERGECMYRFGGAPRHPNSPEETR